MPTAGRLAGAVIFGLFGWYLAGLTIPFFPESNAPDFWLPVVGGISLIIGWRVCGRRAGQGYSPATGIGLTCGVAIVFCSIFIVSFNQMIKNALRNRYRDGTMEAVTDVFNQMIEFSIMFADVTLIATVLIGGVVCAWVTEFFAQRFP
ncbi:TrgA family protein [Roseobacter sp. CCS2]|uniref:TrgA family protein n=1 Tax=Roseobacter sp. CCS2 TaxID=391593 RepID=UPI0000F3C57F|nr:TrgA family protein [Roseobacter sp. CCS2]EBA11888.1 tellurite resistance protein [Roseobacter sp. CCS2]